MSQISSSPPQLSHRPTPTNSVVCNRTPSEPQNMYNNESNNVQASISQERWINGVCLVHRKRRISEPLTGCLHYLLRPRSCPSSASLCLAYANNAGRRHRIMKRPAFPSRKAIHGRRSYSQPTPPELRNTRAGGRAEQRCSPGPPVPPSCPARTNGVTGFAGGLGIRIIVRLATWSGGIPVGEHPPGSILETGEMNP